jgi:hypothetical protein
MHAQNQNPPRESSVEKFEEISVEFENQLKILKSKINALKKSKKQNPKCWGHVGDFSHALEQIKEINSFLK